LIGAKELFMTYDFRIGLVLTTMVLAATGPAAAAPPTVTPSPGYDARLQEQRAAMHRLPAEPHHRKSRVQSARHHRTPSH
jgi:hypothetical protein